MLTLKYKQISSNDMWYSGSIDSCAIFSANEYLD